MQAELTILESQYDSIVEEDIESGENKRHSVYHMRRESNTLWQKSKEIRKLLEEYQQTLIRLDQVSKLKNVDERSYQALQRYLRSPEGVNNFLRGREANPWSEKNRSDLVTLSSRHVEADLLTV
ncbi:hypothetical protein GP486_003489 [Trichoglossum hirsutum]|uniref:DUF6594 domain-containing protein n=1 Tax=Trichoglossum hirsutum TaxID=265104 RepID=A0A9P8LD41_9PEZI|nr:hypothetical protein GP486_003489 [Trichoglossum hirsutum]